LTSPQSKSIMFVKKDIAMSEYEIYLTLSLLSSGLFFIKLLLMLFGSDHDFDIDTGEAFEVFSLQAILASMMGLGWAGLALRFEFEFSSTQALIGGGLFGLGAGVSAAVLMHMMRKLNHATPEYAPEVGSIGKVYISVPTETCGRKGQVELTVGGIRRIVNAVTTAPAPLPPFSNIKVTKVHTNHFVTVEKL
jgi:hypothetical protein